jgi:hypothetical protein
VKFYERVIGKGYYRAIYFFEKGLIARLPTREQFLVGCSHMRLAYAISVRSRPLLRQLFNRNAFRRAGLTEAEADRITLAATKNSAGRLHAVSTASDDPHRAPRPEERYAKLDRVDRLLAAANEVDVLRAGLMHTVVPMAAIAGMGFQIDASHIANHLLIAPHPCEQAVWDIQLLQADEGGLDLLASRTEEARRARTLRGRILRILGTHRVKRGHRFELVRVVGDDGRARYVDAALVDSGRVLVEPEQWDRWYDHVLETVELARKDVYLDRKVEVGAYPAPTVPRFLDRCAMLRTSDYEFFKNRNPLMNFPEIGWPREEAGS